MNSRSIMAGIIGVKDNILSHRMHRPTVSHSIIRTRWLPVEREFTVDNFYVKLRSYLSIYVSSPGSSPLAAQHVLFRIYLS